MTTARDARRLALSLPEATEEDHHGIPSFRIRGKIFATLPDADHLRIFVDAELTQAMVSTNPAAFEELWWGKKLNGVVAALQHAPRDLLAELLEDAWRRRAPVRLVRDLDATSSE